LLYWQSKNFCVRIFIIPGPDVMCV